MQDRTESKTRLRAYPIHGDAMEQPTLDPVNARRLLQEALDSIPDEELRNFRGGQVLIVM